MKAHMVSTITMNMDMVLVMSVVIISFVNINGLMLKIYQHAIIKEK